MINIIQSLFPSLTAEESTKCMTFINTKCSEYYFSSYLKLTNGDVDDAIEYFKLDEKLRALLLRYILRFENQIKTDFACEVETLTGSDSFWSNQNFYLRSATVTKPDGRKSDFLFVKSKITQWINTSRLSRYNGCSNFLAVHACSFGSFLDLIKYIDIPFKTNFIGRYTSFLPLQVRNLSTLSSYLVCVKAVRDRCAHGAYIVTSSCDRCLSVHNKLLSPQYTPDASKNYSMLEITINYLLQYSNCKSEFKIRLKKVLSRYSLLLTKYNGRHSFSPNPITNLF